MSDRMTSVTLPGVSGGFADWGRHDPNEMIRRLRAKAERERDAAQAVLDAADSDFKVATFVGPYARRNYEVLQPGREVQR